MRTLLVTVGIVGPLSACGGPQAPLTVFAAVEKTIDTGDWFVQVTRWVTTIDHVQMSTERDRVVGDDGEANVVVDFMNLPYAVEVVTFDSRVGTHLFNFGVEPPLRTSPRATRFVTDVEVVNMEANGWTHLIEGRAFGPQPDIYTEQPVYTFNLQFDSPVRNLGCGEVEVMGDAENEVFVEVDMEPWLWTSLDGQLGADFRHLAAADQNRDRDISTSELQSTSLQQAGIPGNFPNLYQYLRATLKNTMRGPADCAVRN